MKKKLGIDEIAEALGATPYVMEIDTYKALEPVLLRPAMFFGRPSVTAFFHFYMGMTLLTDDRFQDPPAFRLKNGLFEQGGFHDWVCKKHKWAMNVVLSRHYVRAAQDQLRGCDVAEPSEIQMERVGFDLFVADLKQYQERADANP